MVNFVAYNTLGIVSYASLDSPWDFELSCCSYKNIIL